MSDAVLAANAAAEGFLPHGFCFLWNKPLLWTHVLSDVLIGLAYVVISITLGLLVHRARRDIPFSFLFVAFGLFIIACGLTHFMEIWTLWQPVYWLSGGVKVVTAAASVATAAVLPFVVPKIHAGIRDAKLSRERQIAAERAAAQDESYQLLHAVTEGTTDAVFVKDLDGRYRMINSAGARLLGRRVDEIVGSDDTTLIPREDAAAVRDADRRILASGITQTYEETLTVAGVTRTFLSTKGLYRDARGKIVGLFGVSRDVTEQKQHEAERENLVQALAAERAQLDAVLRQLPVGVVIAEASSGRVILRNEESRRIWRGGSSEASRGEDSAAWPVFRAGDTGSDERRFAADESPLARALRAGEVVVEEEMQIRRGDGTLAVVQVSASPVRGPRGEIVAGVATLHNITARKREELAQRLLIEASDVLASSLDYVATLKDVTRLVVPTLADYCVIDLLGADGQMHRLAEAHIDREKEAILRGTGHDSPHAIDVRHLVKVSLDAGEACLVPEITDAWIGSAAHTPEQLAGMRALGPRSLMLVPLCAREHTLGFITFVVSDSDRRYEAADLALAEELARRATIAIDNARLYDAAERARAEAEEANSAKAQFLANMSHELRTPLNAIRGYAELLEMGVRGPLTEAQLVDLRRIQQSERHLLGLITEILNFARIETGRLDFHPVDLALEAALADVDALIEPQVLGKGLSYEHLPCNRTLAVYADPDKLRQIILNLLSNALKFTEPGGRITLCCEARGQSAAIRVSDTGRGIPPDKLEDIFAPFVQLGRNLNNPAHGTGLGLAISRELARAMGGDLTVESTVGAGSTFTLTLPQRALSSEASAA